MGKAAGDGTIADHYAALARNGHITMPEPPKLPPDAVHLWNAFTELHAVRTMAHLTPNPISYQDIAAYSRLTGWGFDPWEVDAIRSLDDAYLSTPRS